MNEIQKFKAQHSVIKAQDGTYFRSPNDPNIWINRKTKKAYKSRRWRDADPNNHANDFDRYFEEYDDRPTRFISKGKTYVRQGDTYYTVDAQGHPVSQVSNPQFNWVRDAVGNMRTLIKANPAIKPQADTPVDAGAAVKQDVVITGKPKRTSINWGKEFTDFMGGLTEEQRGWLKANGLQDATKLQDYLTNMGFGVGKFGSDGKFGNDSKTAWNNFVASGIMGKNRDQEILAEKQQPVVDAPDPFGYESKGNYSLDNAKTLKTDGIRDWTTMLNYIKGNQDSTFAQDMMHRFGSDLSTWKQEDVEGVIGVSGHYGRKDRSRIQGFMAGNQAAWNDQRQAAINDYAKKTFLANPSGANTLGNQPGLSKEWAGTDGQA